MEGHKTDFAKPLHPAVRLLSAMRVTSEKLDNVTYMQILMCLMTASEPEAVSTMPKNVVTQVSNEKHRSILRQFMSVYEDEDGLAAYLNNKASARYFKRPTGREDAQKTNEYIHNLMQKNLLNILNM